MATINKIDGINVSVITKLIGRERAAFAKRTRHTFGGGASSSGSFIEDNAGFTGVAGVSNGIWTDNGSGQGNYSGINLSTANIIDYTNGEATSDEFTISWWQNLDSSQAAANIAVLGQHGRLKVDLGNVGTGITNPHFKVTFGATLDYVQNTNTGVQMGSTWVHCAVVCKSDGSQLVISSYLNGTKLSNTGTKSLGTKLLPNDATEFRIGGHAGSGSSVKGQFDSIQVSSTPLDDYQVGALAGQSDRQMTIAEAAALPTYLESTADLYGDADTSGGTLALDGTGDYAVIDDGFRFTDQLSTSVWFKTTSTGDRRIYSAHVRGMGGGDFNNGFFARLNNGQLKYRHPAGGSGELTGPSGLNDGNWHHLSVTWEANVGYVMYLDGVQQATGSAGAADGYVTGWGLYIGANPWNGNQPYGNWNGEISKFEVVNDVLTSSEITTRYNAGA